MIEASYKTKGETIQDKREVYFGEAGSIFCTGGAATSTIFRLVKFRS